MRLSLILGSIVALFSSAAVHAAMLAEPANAPAGQGESGPMKVYVDEVGGFVRVRASSDAPWQKATAGMVVDEGAEFQTGQKSFVRCSIPPDQTFVLDRLGTVKVQSAIRDGNKVKTDMLMKYGRTKYHIEAAGLDHELTVASPSATLAVRGTDFQHYDQPPFNYEVNTDHVIQIRDAHRQVSLGSNNTTNKVKISANHASAAATALAGSVTDPRYGMARTQSENVFIAQQVSRGGVISFDPLANILVVRDSNPFTDAIALGKSIPGPLSFSVRWNNNADVNLAVFSQFGDPTAILFGPNGLNPSEYLYPGYGLNISKRGGTIPFDDRGGPRGGTEVAYYKSPLTGVFGLTATLISGPATDIKFNAFGNGKQQFIYGTDAGNNLIKGLTLDLPLTTVGEIQTALVFFPGVPVLEDNTPTQGVATHAKVTKSTVATRSTRAVPVTPASVAVRAKVAIPPHR